MATHLPVIRPESPEFPTVARSRASSGAALAPLAPPCQPRGSLQNVASCPHLPAAKGARKRDEEEQAFLARQLHHSAPQNRRQRSMAQRDWLKRSREEEDTAFWGSKGKEGFRTFLQKKFGGILKGWRAVDSQGSGRLGFHEFCHACRAVGFHGNFKKLWAELDEKDTGSVSLMDVDGEVGHYLGTFKSALVEHYGDLVTGWIEGVDTQRQGHVQEEAFVKAVERLGVALHPGKLFHMLKSRKGVSLLELDPETWKRLRSMRHAPVTEKESDVRGQSKSEEGSKKVPPFPEGFRQALVRRYGSLLAAWREALDVDARGRLTFGEFCFALNRLGLHYEVRNLWSQLTSEEYLYFRDLDARTDELLSEMREKLSQEYGNMLLAWVKGLDRKGNGAVTQKQFLQCCRKAGFAEGAELFRRMQPEGGRGLLSLSHFDTKAFHALSRGDFRMLSLESEPGKSPLKLTFQERNEAGFFYQMLRANRVSKQREFAQACGLQPRRPSDFESIEDFEDLCLRKYGSLLMAWRRLDRHASGKLSSGEFCEALRRLGYAGDFRALFNNYDRQQKGFICLADLDQEADRMVSDFLSLLGDHFGTLEAAWKEGFHQDPHGSITKKDLVEACGSLGYAHDAEKLFKCLQPQKEVLTIWDLDPASSLRLQRGQKAIICTGANEKKLVEESTSTSRTKTFHSFETPGQRQLLVRSLRRRYGSTVQAWRAAFDPMGHGTCGFGVFMQVLEECAFGGKAKVLWEELRGDQAFMCFSDLDASAASLLENVREQLVEQFGSIQDAWYELVEAAGGVLAQDAFVEALQSLGVAVKTPQKLFKMLLSWHGQRNLVLEDLQALLIGAPMAEHEKLWRAVQPRKRTSPTHAATEQRLPVRKASCTPSEAARSVATRAVDEVVETVARTWTDPKAEEEASSPSTAPAQAPTAPATAAVEASAEAPAAPSKLPARKRFAASLLSAAKDGRLEKSLEDFEQINPEG